MKHLYESLRVCAKEEEVKAEFCKFFMMKIFALRGIDHYTEHILFEFKYDRNLKNPENVARVLAQVMYYARLLKFGAGLTKYPLPPVICVVDKNEAFFAETKDYAKFYAAKGDRYDWDRAPSTPCPKLVADVLDYLTRRRGEAEGADVRRETADMSGDGETIDASPVSRLTSPKLAVEKTTLPYIYDLTNPAEEEQFVKKCRDHLVAQMTFFEFLDKKAITEENFLDVFDYWDGLFGAYVRNGRKSSEYFLSDIEQGKSIVAQGGQVLFSVPGAEGYIPKMLQPEKYRHFWQSYEKVPPPGMTRIRQKADRLTEDFRRRFTGEFYTPVEFAAKGLDYLERTIGREWWKSGEYRFWDMAAGTGNLEFELPSSALPSCYISTLEAEDAKYCQKIFPAATCFQYDYLADDIPALAGQMTFGQTRKMPPNLVADLANPSIKWIIFINPPFATANTVGGETGKKSKDTVSKTTIREWMNEEDYGEASRELFTQFLFRISKEFKDRQAHLCMFSKLKYINSNNDQKIRDGFFQYKYERGFIFPIKCFYGATGNFPVGFLVWSLAERQHLAKQSITLDVFNKDAEKIGTKAFPSVERTAMLNKWCPRPKWDGKSIMPTFVSAFNLKTDNKDKRNYVAPGFLCSVSSKGDDFQNQNSVFILSAPYANAGAFSVTPENFERAMVLHAVKKIPKATWTNDRDAFYAPTGGPASVPTMDGTEPVPPDAATGLPSEFVADCVVWSTFADSNYAVSLRNVQYQGRVWQIANQMFPFPLEEVRRWPCAHGDIAAQLAAANEDRFLAKWLAGRIDKQTDLLTPNGVRDNVSRVTGEQIRLLNLSPEARAVMSAARTLYRDFYANITHTPWVDWKIETWDVGYYQVRNAMKSLGGPASVPAMDGTEPVPPVKALREAHDALRAKLSPQVYSLGFLNPDVEYFE
ncbi:MAG: hypothetical protein IJ146_01020 [Kiritimatiellae bacterium]|nr:hypothetical protein [Kiritimatiellia bacterium]